MIRESVVAAVADLSALFLGTFASLVLVSVGLVVLLWARWGDL